jgi:hypothetical protein
MVVPVRYSIQQISAYAEVGRLKQAHHSKLLRVTVQQFDHMPRIRHEAINGHSSVGYRAVAKLGLVPSDGCQRSIS